jgi:hypothetical protein
MKSEFLESELELYVQRLLIHEFYSTNNRYRMLKISPSEERLKGYDAKIVGLTPFYCQFKTSDFLRRGDLYKRRSTFCKSMKWPISPFYSFALRVPNDPSDKKNPAVWQHNVLHRLWKSDRASVAYVAPVFHTKTEMDLLEPLSSYGCCILHDHHFHRSSISIREVAVNGYERCRLPVFEGLISMPPHVPVKDLKHSYSFTSHRDITFHSEPELVEGGRTFGDTLREFVLSSMDRGEDSGLQSLMADNVRNMLGEIGDNADSLNSFLRYGLSRAGIDFQAQPDAARTFDELTPVQRHVALAASLKAYFGITTLGLLKVEEE